MRAQEARNGAQLIPVCIFRTCGFIKFLEKVYLVTVQMLRLKVQPCMNLFKPVLLQAIQAVSFEELLPKLFHFAKLAD